MINRSLGHKPVGSQSEVRFFRRYNPDDRHSLTGLICREANEVLETAVSERQRIASIRLLTAWHVKPSNRFEVCRGSFVEAFSSLGVGIANGMESVATAM